LSSIKLDSLVSNAYTLWISSQKFQDSEFRGRDAFYANPKRKLNYTWELIQMPASLVGINTLLPNRLVYKSICAGKIEALAGYDRITPEVRTGRGSRLDLLLTKDD